MVDSRMKGRVKGLLAGAPSDSVIPDQTHDHAPDLLDPDAQRQALQVLILAQRTADEHVASAHHQAGTIRADARATAEQVAREAHAHAENARQEANRALADAHASAEQIARDAQARADGMRREAEKVLADARVGAAEIVKQAKANAAGLEREAQQRYDDVVGSLAGKRAALQQQIDTLQQFDRDYRARLRAFMQSQLHALGSDEPVASTEIQEPGSVALAGAQNAPE